jgi:chemotaxis protein CheX
MVGLAGHLCGLLSVCCRQESATLIASAMLDLAPNNVADHACDAIGEVANMIAGNFKNKLDGRFRKCMLSVPTVISSADYNFRSLTDAGPLDLWFTFHGLPLEVTLEIHS